MRFSWFVAVALFLSSCTSRTELSDNDITDLLTEITLVDGCDSGSSISDTMANLAIIDYELLMYEVGEVDSLDDTWIWANSHSIKALEGVEHLIIVQCEDRILPNVYEDRFFPGVAYGYMYRFNLASLELVQCKTFECYSSESVSAVVDQIEEDLLDDFKRQLWITASCW